MYSRGTLTWIPYNMPNNNQKNKKKAVPRAQPRKAPKAQNKNTRRDAPLSRATRMVSATPGFGRDSYTVQERVSVAYDVLSQASGAFAVVTLAINPGLPLGIGPNAGPFSWVSSIANKFERYKIKKLEFIYEGFTPSTDAGEFAMCIDYDSSDIPPTSVTSLLNNTGARSCKTWETITMSARMNTQPLMGRKTRSGAVTSDLENYDFGKLYLYNRSLVATGEAIGRLWVKYTMDLLLPQGN